MSASRSGGCARTAASSPVWHPFTQHGLGHPAIEIERTEGAYLVSRDGRRILDGISSWWVTTHGHRHPRIMAAIADAAERYDQLIFAGFTHEPAERLAQALIEMAPARLSHVFYSDSGSTAVEVALKMALGHWRNLGQARTRILALEGAYHGDTVGAMSAGARGVFNASYAPLLFDVGRVPLPRHDNDVKATIGALEAACAGGDVAALIVEPLILGAGGMLTYPASLLAMMADTCRRHGVLLIADEVMTGWGRTGTKWAVEQAGVEPDILCTGKGLTGGSLPLAATLATVDIFDSHYGTDRSRMLFHSSSFTANPIACAAALANIAVWRDEPVAERVATLARRQAGHIADFAGDGRFAAVRRCGTIAAFDLSVGDSGYMAQAGPALGAFFLERDVLLRPLGNTIYVLPPYCITEEELARVYDAIGEAADRFGGRA